MLTFAFALSLTLAAEAQEKNPVLSASSVSRDELALVNKLKDLRGLVEKLPQGWRAASLKPGVHLTKENLISEIEQLELEAAERWHILLQNLAYLDRPLDPEATAVRHLLAEIPPAHALAQRKMDEMSFKIKDGVLLNLASKVMLH